MPIRSTLADLQAAFTQADTLGFKACSPKFLSLANRAQRTLADGGRWYGTVVTARFCQYNGCITFPRNVAVVEKMDICRHSVYIRNQWWEYQTDYPVPSMNRCQQQGWTPELLPRNNVCTFQDLSTTGYIQLYPQSLADVGKIILIQGINAATNEPIEENITLASPFAQSIYQYVAPGLTGVQKPVTTAQVNVTAYYPVSGTYAPIAVWEASEKNPWYIRKYLVNFPNYCQANATTTGCGNYCTDYGTGCAPALVNCQNGIAASFLVRLEVVPLLVPTDWLFITNVEAMLREIQSLNASDQNQFEISETLHQQALRLLRNELDKYQPPQQITVNAQPWGDAHPRRVFGGFW